MKKIIICFISILLVIFMAILYMTVDDSRYNDKIINNILKNTSVKKVNYLKKYNNYYIVMDKEYIYVFDLKYNEILSKDVMLIHGNDNNYDIIYKDDKLMYFNDYMKNDVLVYEYYDIDTYKLISRQYIGGS